MTKEIARYSKLLEAQGADHLPQPADYDLTYRDMLLYDLLYTCPKIEKDPFLPRKKILANYKAVGIRFKEYSLGEKLADLSAILFCIGCFLGTALLLAYLWHDELTKAHASNTWIGITLISIYITYLGIKSLDKLYLLCRNYKKENPTLKVLSYIEAFQIYRNSVADAEKTAHLRKEEEAAAERAILRRKTSYWESLNGYEFELATAEVLKLFQFNPIVTKGSADGGVDIEVIRNGMQGVVQCKAHAMPVGPHVIRDLFGVMNHEGCSFGIIVSRSGFTTGAHDFAKGKSLFLIDIFDLIAMQEGTDVLADKFE
jgi:HJR/Mrr/RecB family endonuclease